MNDVTLSVSDFVALINQTLEYAYPFVTIVGELANFKISKNRWVYFDLKDEFATVRFFGSVYALPGPLENGMVLEVYGNPRLHPLFGFSVNIQSLRPVGKGSIKKAADLLEAKLRAEGLFDEIRKRQLPYPPKTVGLITSKESAAYADFIKILNQRWRGIEIRLLDVQVQGAAAVQQIVGALSHLNQIAEQPEAIVIIRGGGSADDLQVFNTEQVTRAVAGSRIPTLVAVGHEIDVSLAELAADQRASTPSNAAELLVPDRREALNRLQAQRLQARAYLEDEISRRRRDLALGQEQLLFLVGRVLQDTKERYQRRVQLLAVLSPQAALRRGYAIVRSARVGVVKSRETVRVGDELSIQLTDAFIKALVKEVN